MQTMDFLKLMNKKEHIKYWINSAKHDLKTAENLFKNKKY
ncbi:MAG: hypothetical protein ACD_4C00173G0001, partial [uncultured bacterium (gcode 4)]